MIVANQVRTSTHYMAVSTSEADGHMYLQFVGDSGGYSIKLTGENRTALKKVLGPTETWAGIL